MPPPAFAGNTPDARPLASVNPLIVTVLVGLMLKRRNVPLVRCTVSTLAPGPLIVTSFVSVSWPLVRPIGLTTLPLNEIVVPLHASAIACRKLPAPASAFVVTTGFVVHATMTCDTVLLVLGS